MTSKPLAVCLLSGGLDSTVAAAWASESYDVLALHISYGQRAAEVEGRCAQQVASALGVKSFRSTNLSFLQELGGSALTDPAVDIPAGHSSTTDVPVTQVPFRNGIFLAMAVAWAESACAQAVVIGAVEEDSSGYPDCREQFLIGFERAVEMGIKPDRDIRIVAPLVHKSKGDIVRMGTEFGAPLGLTWSCYASGPVPCGACESCLLRAKGFALAHVVDPAITSQTA
jgi:7-cyano-7-deazaguanine synthase